MSSILVNDQISRTQATSSSDKGTLVAQKVAACLQPKTSLEERVAKILKITERLSLKITEAEWKNFLTFADSLIAKPPGKFTVYPVEKTKLVRTVVYSGKSIEVSLNSRQDPKVALENPTKPNKNCFILDLVSLSLRARTMMLIRDEKCTERVLRTSRIFQRLELLKSPHPHVMQVIRMGFSENKGVKTAFNFDVPYYAKGDLFDLITSLDSKKPWDFPHIRKLNIVLQIAKALLYLESKKVIHRDLKLENIFLDDDVNVRVGDFDLSFLEDEKEKEKGVRAGSEQYVPPEDLEKPSESLYPRDTYALGIIFYMLLTEDTSLLIDKEGVVRTFIDFINITVTFPEKLQSEKYKSLANNEKHLCATMLNKDPEKRPPIEQVVSKLEGIIEAYKEKTPSTLASSGSQKNEKEASM